MLSQFTRHTCVLDCFSSYLRELGLNIYSADILTNHRDLCSLDQSAFGAMNYMTFMELVKRYSLIPHEVSINNIADIPTFIFHGDGIFCFCSRYGGENKNHAIRIIRVAGDECEFFSPGFPNSRCKPASSKEVFVDWVADHIIRVTRF